ncbi:MAG: virulence factor TspB C-terminal domain-related protein [Methylococcaceae bacterium]
MKKLFLFCLIFYSNVVLSDFRRISEHSYDYLVGTEQPCQFFYSNSYLYSVNQTDKTQIFSLYGVNNEITSLLRHEGASCKVLGWVSQYFSYSPLSDYSYSFMSSWAEGKTSVDISSDSFLAYKTNSVAVNYYVHDTCERDQIEMGNTRESASCDPGDDPMLGHCECPNTIMPVSRDYLVIQVLKPNSTNFSISEKTLQTTNALISESNSKLGSIATTNAINSNLLSQISQGISNLFSDSGSSSNTGTDTTDTRDSTTVVETCFGIEAVGGCSNLGFDVSGDFSLDSVSFDVSSISPNSSLENSQFSCPSDYSFFVFNRSYSISYLPFCNFATRLRSIVIPAARVAAAWIVIGAL